MILRRLRYFLILVVAVVLPVHTAGQVPAKSVAKELFFDSTGNQITNNEFVDIRMANFHYPDATIVKKFANGRVEFRLQKIPQEGMPAPNFSVKTLDGKTLTLADLRGRVVVLSFWFIGCPACLGMEPKLNEFKAKFADQTDVLFLAMTADPAGDVRKYLAKERFDFIHAVEAGAAMKLFAFSGYPKNIVIGKNGEIVYWRSTIRAWDKFESVVREQLAKN